MPSPALSIFHRPSICVNLASQHMPITGPLHAGSRWQSLRWRLPVTISLVMTTILAVVIVVAYREFETAMFRSGTERARAAAGQVAALLEAPMRTPIAQVRTAAASAELRDAIKDPTPERLAKAREALSALAVGGSPRIVTLWDNRGNRLSEAAAPPDNTAPTATAPQPGGPPASEGLQLQAAGERALLQASAIVSDLYPTHAPLGYLVFRSAFAINPPGLFSRLVGDGAAVLLVDRTAGLWVDLASSRFSAAPANNAITAAVDIRDTPLQIAVVFPDAAILAPARQFLRRITILGLLIALASAVAVRALSIRFTRPLTELMTATEAVAAGDYSRTVGDPRGDEFGRLGRAFDAMTLKVAEDMNARERAAAALRANEERLRFTLNAARVGTWQMMLETGAIEWSETMGPMFGVIASELPRTREGLHEVIHPDDRAEIDACLRRDVTDLREHEVYFRPLRPDNLHKWVLSRSRIVTDGERLLVGVCFDVTEQKDLEAQLRQAQKMDAIGKLAGGIAHDFNNLLTAILGFGNVLLESVDAGDPRRTHIEQILKAGQRAADLTAQLLAFSRQQLVQPVIIDVNLVVEDNVGLLRRLIGENIRLETVAAPVTATVRADPVQLQQILMNLAINARDAMQDGGRLTIEITNCELDEHYSNHHYAVVPGKYVCLAVSDTGVGMTEAVRARLFEPFFTTKKRGEGTGLGLATVYGAVKQSGGYISAYGEPGMGSAFKVYLPYVEGQASSPVSAAAAPSASRGTETILLVEDEAAVRQLARMMLERSGYRVLLAATAEEAETMHLTHAGAIRMLITDVVLPGSSGPDLFQRLSIRDPRLKVLYMSGYTDDAVFRTGRLQHGVAFVQKPFTADALRKKTREVLDS
jgi:PAS domain S-box-containing protein